MSCDLETTNCCKSLALCNPSSIARNNQFEGLEDSDEDEEDYSSDEDEYEGWFWTRGESLKNIWFEDSQKDVDFEVYTWDKGSRPVRQET